jgi:hypothetical protein
MSDREFQVHGKHFKLSKLDPFKQFHILRRLAPILADLAPLAKDLAKQTEDDQMKAVGPIMNGLAKLSDEDSNRVFLGLLSSVEVKQEHGNWAFVAMGDQLMFQDLELPTLMHLCGRAFGYNLKGFLAKSP